MFDVAILGAGVIGSAIAYELSRYKLKVLLLEKENDVSLGASRANTAIIHGGYDPEPETLMGKFNVEGQELCMELCATLDVEHKKTGSLVLAFDEEDEARLLLLYEQGLRNGVKGMEILDAEQLRLREANLSPEVKGALWVPESGVINPWEFTLALAEVAIREGIVLRLNRQVISLSREGDFYRIGSAEEEFRARYVVNATGVHSDEIHNLVAEPAFSIRATRGEYYLLDRICGQLLNSVIFQCPSKLGKGVLIAPTVHDNILVGPNSEEISDKEDTAVTRAALDDVARQARRSMPDLDLRCNIRNYAGIRANSDYGDFFIKISAPCFLDVAAIKSPGLTCAPRIARYALELLEAEGLELAAKEAWNGERRVVRFKEIPEDQRAEFVRRHPLYGRVICRCETITEGEIVAALRRGIPVASLDGVKRRCGTGMGRCQGGFCGPRVLEILAREYGLSAKDILQDKSGSYILSGETKKGGSCHHE